MLNLALVGLNHRTAGVDARERAAFGPSGMLDSLRALSARTGIQEALIISTCNRVEILSRVDELASGIASLEAFLSERSAIPIETLGPMLYRLTEDQAIRHLFRVASSLDSMVLGEPQILGQVKASYGVATEAQTAGIFLNTLLQAALRVAKRVRTETSIGEYSVSISSAAVELACKIFEDLSRASILIVGAGKMGEVAVRHLAAAGSRAIRVANRSAEAARSLAARFGGSAVPWSELVHWMARSDIVITSTGASEVIVDRRVVDGIMRERRNSPLVLIDISVPRNIDPAASLVPNVFCYDIDDLGAVIDASLQERRRAAALAEKLVDQEVAAVASRLQSLDVAPVVVHMQGRIEEICRAELERFLHKAGTQDARTVRELENMVTRIAGKVAHPWIMQLRSNHQEPAQRDAFLAAVRKMFGIPPADES